MGKCCSDHDDNNSGLCSHNNTADNPVSGFFSLPPVQFTMLSVLLGIILIENLDLDQQNTLGNFIVNVGQVILTAAAQGQTLQSAGQEKDQVRQQIQILKKQISALEQGLEG